MTEKLIELNKKIEMLIDVAHATYMCCTDEKEKVRLDGQIRAYWTTKNLVEDILKEDNNDDTIYKFLTYVRSKEDEYPDDDNTGWSLADLVLLAADFMEAK